jgi:hypothetical protein
VPFSVGHLQGKVYKNNPCTAEVLQNEVAYVIASAMEDELQKVSHNLFMCYEACLKPG